MAKKATQKRESATVTDMAAVREARRGKKPPSAARLALMAQVESAEGAEKKIANQQLKALKFRELGLPRVNKALKAIRQLQNLTNKAQYSWTEEESKKIQTALIAEVNLLVSKLNSTSSKEEEKGFTF